MRRMGSLVLSLSVCGVAAAVDLSGVWDIRAQGIESRIRLPGTMAAAKLGSRWTEHDFETTMDLPQSEALVQEYQYVGEAVYVRTVELSAADCAHDLELFLERVMWRSEAWLDGRSLGVRDSLGTPHVHPVPKALLSPGRHELRIAVDNSCLYGFSRQSHAYGPNMQAVWNGILGRIELRRAHPLRSARVFAGWPAKGTFEIETPVELGEVAVDGLDVREWERRGDRVIVRFAGEPVCWNEFHPRLYTVRLVAADGFGLTIRFGFRSVGTRGLAITLNGNAIFTRGNVENANFALNGIPWMETAEWLKVFRTLKERDGVNAIRFHSWTPPEAAFRAADELGLLMQPEAGIWTDKWMSEGDEIGNGKPVDAFVRRELRDIVDAYGNSPSFLSLSVGNELGNSNFRAMESWLKDLRRHDPRTLYYCSSARDVMETDDLSLSHVVPAKGLARQKLLPRTDWDYEDIYGAATVPTVAHEIGQWPVYPLWDELLAKFTGTMRPWNLSRHRDTAIRNGTVRFTNEYHRASARLSRLIYKEEVESFLRTPSCAGLQLLNIQDYTGQAEALVGWRDPFYDLKPGFGDLPEFNTVWGPLSFLARLPKFSWTAGETFVARLQIRNLTDRTIPAGTAYPYSLGGASGTARLSADVAPGALGEAGEVSLPLTAGMAGAKHVLTFGANRWDFWVFPREGKCAMPAGVVLTHDLAEMKRAVADGRTVLYTGRSRRSGKCGFKPVYWSARWFTVPNRASAHLGTWFDVAHPALAGFPTEEFTDWQWYDLAENGVIHEPQGLPKDYRPIGLSVNDFHFGEFAATLYEVRIGKGRLLVCGYDLDRDEPATRRLRASLAAYLAGPCASDTPEMDPDWLAREFDVTPDRENLDGAVYDVTTNWTGRVFSAELRGFAPLTGTVRIDFLAPDGNLTSGRGLLEGRVFEVPFTRAEGKRTSVTLPIMREDMLDGRLELSVNIMTGNLLGIERIRVFPSK